MPRPLGIGESAVDNRPGPYLMVVWGGSAALSAYVADPRPKTTTPGVSGLQGLLSDDDTKSAVVGESLCISQELSCPHLKAGAHRVPALAEVTRWM
jgi:hypothetical protein